MRSELIELGHSDMTCMDQVREGQRVFSQHIKTG
jgi:hypothetical protein